MCTEAEARKIIGAEGAATLIKIIDDAWKAHVEEGKVRSRRTRAAILWDYMIEGADKELASMEGVRRFERHNTPLYVLRDRLLVRFKKHDDERMTRNYPTEEQQALDRQGHFDGLTYPHVTCGYMLDRAEAEVAKYLVVRRVAGRVEWWIDLPDLAGGQLQPASPIIPTMPGDDSLASLPSIVRPRRAQEDNPDR